MTASSSLQKLRITTRRYALRKVRIILDSGFSGDGSGSLLRKPSGTIAPASMDAGVFMLLNRDMAAGA